MKKINLLIFLLVILFNGCVKSGDNGKSSLTTQTGYTEDGKVSMGSGQRDVLQFDNVEKLEIHYNEYNKEELISALEERDTKIKELEGNINSLIPGKFIINNSSIKQLPNGNYESRVNLSSEGNNIIPLFIIEAQTFNNAIIDKIIIKGKTALGYGISRKNKSKTLYKKEYRNIEPGDITVIITTDKYPGNMRISITPLKK